MNNTSLDCLYLFPGIESFLWNELGKAPRNKQIDVNNSCFITPDALLETIL